MVPRLLLLIGALLIGGCATTSSSTSLLPDHPASVDAPEAPYAPPPSPLAGDRTDSSPTSAPGATARGHVHHGASSQPAATDSAGTTMMGEQPTAQPQQVTTTYTCPMHADVVQSSPGECPKCGMRLVKRPSSGGLAPHEGGHHD
jgi:hypothetical protein